MVDADAENKRHMRNVLPMTLIPGCTNTHTQIVNIYGEKNYCHPIENCIKLMIFLVCCTGESSFVSASASQEIKVK